MVLRLKYVNLYSDVTELDRVNIRHEHEYLAWQKKVKKKKL